MNKGLLFIAVLVLTCIVFVGCPLTGGNGDGDGTEVNQWTSLGPEGGTIHALIIDPINTDTLFTSTDDGVFKSIDGGISWTASNSGLNGLFTGTLAIDPVNTDIVVSFRQAWVIQTGTGWPPGIWSW